jgi:hypothetical protein
MILCNLGGANGICVYALMQKAERERLSRDNDAFRVRHDGIPHINATCDETPFFHIADLVQPTAREQFRGTRKCLLK